MNVSEVICGGAGVHFKNLTSLMVSFILGPHSLVERTAAGVFSSDF